MVKEIMIAGIAGSLGALGVFFLLVKENQVNIDNLTREIVELKDVGKSNSKSLVATKLFIAQAHPRKDASSLVSIQKLKKFDVSEVDVLARYLSAVQVGPSPRNELVKFPVDLEVLIKKHKLNGSDFLSFSKVANIPTKNKPINP